MLLPTAAPTTAPVIIAKALPSELALSPAIAEPTTAPPSMPRNVPNPSFDPCSQAESVRAHKIIDVTFFILLSLCFKHVKRKNSKIKINEI